MTRPCPGRCALGTPSSAFTPTSTSVASKRTLRKRNYTCVCLGRAGAAARVPRGAIGLREERALERERAPLEARTPIGTHIGHNAAADKGDFATRERLRTQHRRRD